MAIRVTTLCLTILYVTGLVLGAAITRNTSQPLSVITKHSQAQATSEPASGPKAKRARLFRVDRAIGENYSRLISQQNTSSMQLSTFSRRAKNTEVVPVFASDNGKPVIIDTNGDVMGSYASERLSPVWSRERKHYGFHRSHALGQQFALFILGFSLALALICLLYERCMFLARSSCG